MLSGLRTRDRQQLVTGLALLGYSYLTRTRPRRQLVYRKVLKGDQAIVIRAAEPGSAPLDRKQLRRLR